MVDYYLADKEFLSKAFWINKAIWAVIYLVHDEKNPTD